MVYVLLRNLPLVLQKRPNILESEIKCFFCNWNDPYYIKHEKLDIMVRIVEQKNYEIVLNELKEYINEADPDFVRRTIRAIGRVTVNFPQSVDK